MGRNLRSSSSNIVCSTCKKQFAYVSSLRRHKLTHSNAYIYCNQCCKAFLTKARLIKHFRVMHWGEKNFKCTTCGRRYAYSHSLKKHKRKHVVAYKCKICDKTFSNVDTFKLHKRKHKSKPKVGKIFNCGFCDKKFVYKHVLVRHMLLHSKKQFLCCSCNMHFFRKDVLDNHIRVMHEQGKQFVCNECDKSFAYKHTLIIHLRKHTGEKPFGCTYCGKKFSRKDNLCYHELRHTIEKKKYICAYCNAVLNYKDQLRNHVNEHLKSINLTQNKTNSVMKHSKREKLKQRLRKKSNSSSAHAFSEVEKSKRHSEGKPNGIVTTDGNCRLDKELDNLKEVSKSTFSDKTQQCNRVLTLKLVRLSKNYHMNMCYLCGMSFSCQDHVNSHVELMHNNYSYQIPRLNEVT